MRRNLERRGKFFFRYNGSIKKGERLSQEIETIFETLSIRGKIIESKPRAWFKGDCVLVFFIECDQNSLECLKENQKRFSYQLIASSEGEICTTWLYLYPAIRAFTLIRENLDKEVFFYEGATELEVVQKFLNEFGINVECAGDEYVIEKEGWFQKAKTPLELLKKAPLRYEECQKIFFNYDVF